MKQCFFFRRLTGVSIFFEQSRPYVGRCFNLANNLIRDMIRRFFFSMFFKCYKSRPPGALVICKCCFILKYLESGLLILNQKTPHTHTPGQPKISWFIHLKILSSQKWGGTRVVRVHSPRLHTQSTMFFRYTERATLVISTSTNWLQRLGLKTVESFLCGVRLQCSSELWAECASEFLVAHSTSKKTFFRP